MDIETILHHPITVSVLGTAVTAPFIKEILNRWSGATPVFRNADYIERMALDFASQTGLNIEAMRTAPLRLESISSLLIVNAETAAITIPRKSPYPIRYFAHLYDDAGLFKLLQIRSLIDDPEAVFTLMEKQVSSALAEKSLRRIRLEKHWLRPGQVRNLFAFFNGEGTLGSRAARTREALDLLARVLAASPEKDINLCGGCHIGLKVDGNIVVMPTTNLELQLMQDIACNAHSLPMETISPRNLRAALIAINAAEAKLV